MSPKTSTKSRRSTRAIAAIDIDAVKSRILHVRNQEALLDRDVAALYGVETREINQAVRNNRNKFPNGYAFEMSHGEVEDLRSNILTANVSSNNLKKGCVP